METRSPLEPGAAIVPRERGIPRSGDSSEVAANKSLPFVHTARRYYRLNDRARPSDRSALTTTPCVSRLVGRKDRRARPFRGSKSRNKVSVGEPADGSFTFGKNPAASEAKSEEPRLRTGRTPRTRMACTEDGARSVRRVRVGGKLTYGRCGWRFVLFREHQAPAARIGVLSGSARVVPLEELTCGRCGGSRSDQLT